MYTHTQTHIVFVKYLNFRADAANNIKCYI